VRQIFPATELIAAVYGGYGFFSSQIMHTARSIASAEKLRDILIMAPFSNDGVSSRVAAAGKVACARHSSPLYRRCDQ
jgi:hypothetical protein